LAEKVFYEPLSARDAWFLYAERQQTPLDLGTVYVFEGGSRVAGGRGALGVDRERPADPADERAERLSPAEFSELAGRLAR